MASAKQKMTTFCFLEYNVSSSSSSNLFPQVPTMNEMIDMWKNKKMNTFGILYSWFLAKVFLDVCLCS